ncbi:MAG TPA: gamma-glutamyltransferase family protein [Thermohalobaculum sp.]|nr:gamma-glutamyltransferase family protein [Thermohalobaculum sp.]
MRDFHLPGRSTAYARGGMAATSHPAGAKAAVDLLEAGGNAVDAAIAGAVALGFCEPAMTGLGGDMFALVAREGTGAVVGVNGSGRAPAGADAARLRARGLTEIDEGAADGVVVPAAVAGFELLARDHGVKGLDAALQPAIRLAEEGVPTAPRAAFDWELAAGRLTGAARRHLTLDGRAPRPGDVMRYPGQAEVLRRIARDGARAFYEGEVAEDMVAGLSALGGAHTLDDFARCRADYVDPIAAPYRDHEIVELPPNGHGATALLLARILEHFDLAALDPLGPERAHLEIEAAKLAYAARDEAVADPEHMTVPVEELISAERADAFAARIDRERAMEVPRGLMGAPHRDTIYITVVDRDRTAVSLIYSIFSSFGSAICSEKFGINFNNRATGFVLTEGHPNELGPAKRPLHTIIPGLLRKEGRTVMPFGVMGGQYQPTGHARLLTNILDYGMDVQQAIDAPRLFHDGRLVEMERGYPAEVRPALEAMGHRTAERHVPLGGAQAILIDRDRGVLIGGSDPRKDGIALGF